MRLQYKDLNASEKKYVKKYIANGCGAKGSFFNPPDYVFGEGACKIHDFDFWVGGNKADYKKANKDFYKNMIKNCKAAYKNKKINYISYLWVKGAAWRYYKSVSLFGKDAFFWTDTPRTKSDLFFLMRAGKPQKKSKRKAGEYSAGVRG